MTPEGHNDLLPTLERILRDSDGPRDCNELFDMPEVKRHAASPNRVSDYLGVLFRRGLLTRVARNPTPNNKARWAYMWKNKKLPDWAQGADVVEFKPKSLVDRTNMHITEDGANIYIETPHLSISIKKK